MPDLWDRQRLGPDGQFVEEGGELEPVLWYGRFQQFLTMGPERSLLECVNLWRDQQGHKRTNNPPGGWRKQSGRWRWAQRAEEWDLDQQRRRFAENLERIERARQRHASLGRGLQQLATHGLQELIGKAERGDQSLTPDEARRLAETGIDIERTADGLPTEIMQLVVDLMGMDPDELASYEARLASSLERDTGGDGDAGDQAADD